MNSNKENYKEENNYTEFVRARVMDTIGFPQPVEALSILTPKDWQFEGQIIWNPPGTPCAGNNLHLRADSPDGKFRFEMLPNDMWAFAPDQGPMNPNVRYCWYGAPMNAEAYFRNVFAPNELGNPEITAIHENTMGVEAMQQSNNKSRQELMQYGASGMNFYPSGIHATIKWKNGFEGIVLCGVNIMETFVPNVYNGTSSTNYLTVATERVVFMHPEGESEKATRMLSVMMGSIRTNTDWKNAVDHFWLGVRQQSHQTHIGTIRMIDERTRQIGANAIRQGQQRLAQMDSSHRAQMDINTRSWEAKPQSGDSMHTDFVKAIREVETYRDETGVIELSSGYNHAWSRSDGSSFIMSDNPNFDPSSVFQDQSWKEMNKV